MITLGKENVELFDKVIMASEQRQDPFDNSRCVDPDAVMKHERYYKEEPHLRLVLKALHYIKKAIIDIGLLDKLPLDGIEVVESV